MRIRAHRISRFSKQRSGDWEREVAVGTFGLALRYGRICEVRHPGAEVTGLQPVLLAAVEQRLDVERPA